MREKYPHLFTDSGNPFRPCFPSFDRSGTENQLSELCDGMAGWTVTGVTDRRDPTF